jgi:hypothetical protein
MLLRLRQKILDEIGLAVESKDSRRIMAETARLAEVENLIERQEALDKQIAAISRGVERASSTQLLIDATVNAPTTAGSPREAGSAKRREFVRACAAQGILLTPKKGVLYENARREVVGIATATERKEKAWFLGLPSNGLLHAVLICEQSEGKTLSVCLPRFFIEKYWAALSESKGQKKFNVRSRGGSYVLLVPGFDPIPVDEYVDRPEYIAG